MARPTLLALSFFLGIFCATTLLAADPSPLPSQSPQQSQQSQLLQAPPQVQPHPRIWSGLVLATNGPNPAKPPGVLQKVAAKLRNIFGYNQFQVIGESSDKFDSNERWLIPSKEFYMSVRGPAASGSKAPTKIVLFQNRKRVAELEANIGPDKPLFIRGPQYAKGQLLIVVRYADPAEVPPGAAAPGANAAVIHTTTVGPAVLPLPTPQRDHVLLPGMPALPKDRLQPFYPQSDRVVPIPVTPPPDAADAAAKTTVKP